MSSSKTQMKIGLEPYVSERHPYETIRVSYGNDFLDVQFRRTLRVPEDFKLHDSPTCLGLFPLFSTKEFPELPQGIASKLGVFLPIYQREGLSISFSSARPFLVKVYSDNRNVVSGLPKGIRLQRHVDFQGHEKPPPQDYIVPPKQLWLDGVAHLDGKAEQFIARPVDKEYTVNASLNVACRLLELEFIPTKNKYMQIKLALVGHKAIPEMMIEVHPDDIVRSLVDDILAKIKALNRVMRMSYDRRAIQPFDSFEAIGVVNGDTIYVYLDQLCDIGEVARERTPYSSPAKEKPGGYVRQRIFPDFLHATDWNRKERDRLSIYVHMIRACDFQTLTSLDPPPTPVNKEAYKWYDYPFLDKYKEPGEVVPESPAPQKYIAVHEEFKGNGEYDEDGEVLRGNDTSEDEEDTEVVPAYDEPAVTSGEYMPIGLLGERMNSIMIHKR